MDDKNPLEDHSESLFVHDATMFGVMVILLAVALILVKALSG